MLLKNIIFTTCFIVFTMNPVFSQQNPSDVSEKGNEKNALTINEDNFACFQSLHCLVRKNPFKNSNLDEINFDNNRMERYVVEGSAKNESMYAVYNSSGNLIRATVVQRNIALPKSISRVLAAGNFESWDIIGNELVIENFNKDRMQYKVILQKGEEVRVEYFNKYGQYQNQIL